LEDQRRETTIAAPRTSKRKNKSMDGMLRSPIKTIKKKKKKKKRRILGAHRKSVGFRTTRRSSLVSLRDGRKMLLLFCLGREVRKSAEGFSFDSTLVVTPLD
jgi:tRNA A37 threonylcarbamoyladenosine synthetase subunit TsaC/SUA5/YrdC